jgi:Tol biopolymer transport system component
MGSLAALLVLIAVAVGDAAQAQTSVDAKGRNGLIAFNRFTIPRDESSSQVFTMTPSGDAIRQLTDFPGGSYNPDWSPDGTRIAFGRPTTNEPSSIYSMNTDGADIRKLTSGCPALGECLEVSQPSYSPDGGSIAFSAVYGPEIGGNASRISVLVMRSDGSSLREVLDFRLDRDGREPQKARWSPDGKQLAVTLENTRKKPRGASALFVFNIDGTHLKRITPFRLNAGNPDWSPNGKRIVFNSSYEGQSNIDIYTVGPNGKGLKRITRNKRGRYSFEPVWSPDGKRIVVVHGPGTGKRGVPDIYVMRANGSQLKKLTPSPLYENHPDWGTH